MGFSSKTWACPFFKWDERLCVHCESARAKFKDRETMMEYIDKYCASVQGWEKCSLAATLLRYYERNEKA